jgi:cytoskeleton protein RodZ
MNQLTDPEAPAENVCVEIGAALAQARKKAKLSQADVADKLKVTGWIVEVLEQGDWSRLGPSVYCRGYLQHYGRLVDVSIDTAESYFQCQIQPEPTQVLPAPRRSQWLPYQRLMAYAAATALIAVPAAWLAQSMLTNSPLSDVYTPAPIVSAKADLQTRRQPTTAAVEPSDRSESDPVDVVRPVFVEAEPIPSPVMASMSSLPSASTQEPEPVSTLELQLVEDAWLEVENQQGEQLAFGLMKAETVHRFPTDNGLNVRIGNADAVTATLDGEPFDLAAHTSRDLAKFELPAASEAGQ